MVENWIQRVTIGSRRARREEAGGTLSGRERNAVGTRPGARGQLPAERAFSASRSSATCSRRSSGSDPDPSSVTSCSTRATRSSSDFNSRARPGPSPSSPSVRRSSSACRLQPRGAPVQLDEHRDLGAQQPRVERLGQVVDRARRVAAVGVLPGLARRGEEDDRDVPGARSALDVLRGLEAVHLGHHDVEQDQREVVAQQLAQRVPARGDRHDLHRQRVEHRGERDQVLRTVVDGQDPRGGGHRTPPPVGDGVLAPACHVRADDDSRSVQSAAF